MTDSDRGSITKDLDALRAGTQSATGRVVRTYGARLRGLVRARVRWYGRAPVSADEEDVANAALNSVVIRLRRGEYPGVVDRVGFWRLLARFAVRKAGRIARRWKGQPRARPLSSTMGAADPGRSPSSLVASVEETERLLDALRAYRPPKSQHPSGDELVRLVGLLAEGHDIPGIAGRLGVARCTVYRWIDLVRKIGHQAGITGPIDGSAR
jgi:hypothetical protein